MSDAARAPRKGVPIPQGKSTEETSRNVAEVAVSPALAGQRVVMAAEGRNGLTPHMGVPELISVLESESRRLSKADPGEIGQILAAQILSLQSLYARLVELSLGQSSVTNIQAMMRLGLRAQAQCRATSEALVAINRPPAIMAKQANFGAIQQVNNAQIQLSEDEYELRSNRAAQGASESLNSSLEALAS